MTECSALSDVPKSSASCNSGGATSLTDDIVFPATGWRSLPAARLVSCCFTMHTMLSYFLDTVTSDGPNCNFKAVAATDSKSLRLFQNGYVQKIELVKFGDVIFYRARCQPEMRSRADYKLKLAVRVKDDHREIVEVVFVSCTCPAGKGPKASCKHIAAFMYALEEFTKFGYNRDVVTCTDQLQSWNKPSGKRSEPMRVSDMTWQRKAAPDTGGAVPTEHKSKRKHSAKEMCDPRAVQTRGTAQDALDKVAYTTFKSRAPPIGLMLVAGSNAFERVQKERRLEKQGQKKAEWQEKHSALHPPTNADDVTPTPSECGWLDDEDRAMAWYDANVLLTDTEALALQAATVLQAASDTWTKARRVRITASVAHTVTHRRATTDPTKLVDSIVARRMFSTAATDWGIRHEEVAKAKYVAEKKKAGVDVKVTPCGLMVNTSECWFGASPDGIVEGDEPLLLLEVKCPYSCRDMSLLEAAQCVDSFYLQEVGNELLLKHSHPYFSQVQMQLFASSARACDFVVWTNKDIHVERIRRNDEVIDNMLSLMRPFYFSHILPRLALA